MLTQLSNLFPFLSLKDVCDILIVSFLIYQMLLIIKGTKAVQMLGGLATLVLLFWFGISFKLYSLNWVLNHFFDSFFIISVILFQDQIRNALAHFGAGKRIFGVGKTSEMNLLIEEICEAALSLAKEKVGALIVFERGQGLQNFSETGTSTNSETHADLLYAIFQSKSPLHDGAIIISGQKIKSAGCFLPLAKESDLEQKLGTRHRAGIGISEVTDAISLIVSEETGNIHIAEDGALALCETRGELRDLLRQKLTNAKVSHSSSFKKVSAS